MTNLQLPISNNQTLSLPRIERSALGNALVITRREIRDSFRDWRIMTPIFILTLIFPALMNFTAKLATNWVAQYDAQIVGERLIPFLLMVVGFFPISFSLVIALETFVGEKERNSIEPLLSMPVTDLELYIGKMLAALIVPLTASYLGIAVYLIGLKMSINYTPDFWLAVQMFLLTTAEGLVMVSGAVVISSQTTSVRAANLLASFIIIPMALMLQAESVLLFWGEYLVLWLIILAMLVVDLILVRMGVRIFNREEILGKEMDTLNLKSITRDFIGYFLRPPERATARNGARPPFNLGRMVAHDVPQLLKRHRLPIVMVALLVLAGGIAGASFAPKFPLPPGSIDLSRLPADAFDDMQMVSFLPTFSTWGIFRHNAGVIFLSSLMGIISFGVIPVILLMAPMALVGYFAGAMALLGFNPWLFLATFILPHGILELPAAIIGTGFALRIGAALVSPPQGLDVGQGFLLALADFMKVFLFFVLPLLLLAAFVEAHITPQIVLAVYAGG